MKDNEQEDQQAGIGHQLGGQGAAAVFFLDGIALGAGRQVLVKKGQAGKHMDKSEGQQSQFGGGDQRPQGVEMLGIGVECILPAVDGQVPRQVTGQKPDETVDWSSAVKLDKKGLIIADTETGQAVDPTSGKLIFAGGDIVRGPALVVEAVQDGKLAARAIAKALA